MLLQLSQYQLTIDLLEEPDNIDYFHFIPTPYNFTNWEDVVRMVQQYLILLTCQTRTLLFRTPPPLFVIDDSSWKNAAESLTVALTLTLGGVRKCNSAYSSLSFMTSLPRLKRILPTSSSGFCYWFLTKES